MRTYVTEGNHRAHRSETTKGERGRGGERERERRRKERESGRDEKDGEERDSFEGRLTQSDCRRREEQ